MWPTLYSHTGQNARGSLGQRQESRSGEIKGMLINVHGMLDHRRRTMYRDGVSQKNSRPLNGERHPGEATDYRSSLKVVSSILTCWKSDLHFGSFLKSTIKMKTSVALSYESPHFLQLRNPTVLSLLNILGNEVCSWQVTIGPCRVSESCFLPWALRLMYQSI